MNLNYYSQSSNKNNKKVKIIYLSILSGFIVQNVWAEEPIATQTLETVHVTAKVKRNQPAVERKNREVLTTEMVQNNQDLVRYSTDVGVADQGRHSKGFSMRGVEDNRVGISVDGVALPDSEENSLYKRYGNLNTSRQSIDPELARSVEISKGADSFNQGSGNLGGGVNYRTMEFADIVNAGQHFGGLLRNGYATRNREWVNTLGLGYQGDKAQLVALYSHRYGHEMKSAGKITLPEDEFYSSTRRSSRQIPDAAKHQNHSFLTKFTYQLNDNNLVGVSVNGQQGKNHIVEDSATTLTSFYREADDVFKRRTANAFYEYTPDSQFISRIKVDGDYQKTETSAHNYEGKRAGEDWSGKYKPAEPSDLNVRSFNTNFARFNVRMDSQPLDIGGTKHQLSLKASTSQRNFKVQHHDALWDSDNNTWKSLPDSTMMHPVKSLHHQISVHDDIEFSPQFSGHIGVRYDVAKHSQQDLGNLECTHCVKTDDAHFHNWTWTAGVDAKLNPNWQLGYAIGTGFRIPNASEMYFDYRDNAAGAWMSNPQLKAERSLTQNINLLGKGNVGKLSINLHHTRYQDFLNEQETWEKYTAYDRTNWRPVQQMQNLDNAKVYGVEATGKLNLNSALPVPEGLELFGSVGYSKGKMSNGANLLSIQPLKAVIGLDYKQPDGKWGVFSRLSYLGAKKAKDAQYMKTLPERCLKEEKIPNPYYDFGYGDEYEISCTEYAHETGLESWKHLNKKAFVFDVYGFYKPTKQLTLHAGVYNLFNQKYHTWDTLRGLNTTGGVVNSVGVRENTIYGGYPGLERYYQPGRNYAVSLEYKF